MKINSINVNDRQYVLKVERFRINIYISFRQILKIYRVELRAFIVENLC